MWCCLSQAAKRQIKVVPGLVRFSPSYCECLSRGNSIAEVSQLQVDNLPSDVDPGGSLPACSSVWLSFIQSMRNSQMTGFAIASALLCVCPLLWSCRSRSVTECVSAQQRCCVTQTYRLSCQSSVTVNRWSMAVTHSIDFLTQTVGPGHAAVATRCLTCVLTDEIDLWMSFLLQHRNPFRRALL